jgi:hypothetical protein
VAGRIAVAQHQRQRDHRHGDHRCRHCAGNGAEDRADEDHRIGQSAAHRSEQLPDGIEQIFGKPATVKDRAHEGKERDRQQQRALFLRHDGEDLVDQIA